MRRGRHRGGGNGRLYVEGTVVQSREASSEHHGAPHRAVGALVAVVIVVAFVALTLRRTMSRRGAV